MMKKIINNIPNAITISRIISCLIGSILFSTGSTIPALGFYVYGAVSDAFDGFLARKLNAISDFGKKIDPISDKLYALSLMVPAIILGNYSMIITLVLEGLISGINIYSNVKYQKTHTEKVGKIKTIVLFPTMILGLLSTSYPSLYVAYLPSLIISSKFQADSMLAYYYQLEKIKKEENDSSNYEEIININTLNNVKDNTYNLTKSTNNKNKKLVRKKEYK